MKQEGICFIRDLPVEESESYIEETEALYGKNGYKIKCEVRPAASNKAKCVDIWCFAV